MFGAVTGFGLLVWVIWFVCALLWDFCGVALVAAGFGLGLIDWLRGLDVAFRRLLMGLVCWVDCGFGYLVW